MGNSYSHDPAKKEAAKKLPILSCDLWKLYYPKDGVYFCTSDRIIDFMSFTLTFVFLYQIWVYKRNYKIEWKDHRVIILMLCCFSCFYTFCHYSLMHGVIKGYTYFIIAISRITIFSLVFYYFCMKASKLMINKFYILNALKITTVLGILTSSTTGLIIDFYVIPDDLNGNGLSLCKTPFIMMEESIDIFITTAYFVIFYLIKRTILSEERIDSI